MNIALSTDVRTLTESVKLMQADRVSNLRFRNKNRNRQLRPCQFASFDVIILKMTLFLNEAIRKREDCQLITGLV